MNEYFSIMFPLIIFIVLFFIISILLFNYLGVTFNTNKKKILKRVVTVETYNNYRYNNIN